MSSPEAVTFRFPTVRKTEFVLATATPKVGDTFTRGTDEWEVISVDRDSDGRTVVTLAPLMPPVDGKPQPAN